MLKNTTLKNFRCFEKLELTELKSINVIVGPNGSGKTALLESLLLGLRGHPTAAILLSGLRGIPTIGMPQGLPAILLALPAKTVFESSWDHFLYQGNKKLTAEIVCEDDNSVQYKVKMHFATETVVPTQIGIQNVPAITTPFVFERTKGQGALERIFSLVDTNNQHQFQGPSGEFGPTTFFFGTAPMYSEQDNVNWFSNLSIQEPKLAEELLGVLREAFPQIEKLVVWNPSGPASIWANLHSGSTRQLSLVSAGIHKFLSLMLACVTLRNGVILVDEIENGIYYLKHGALWKALLTMCKKNDNQLFITTHSRESLLALGRVMEENNAADSFRMLRTEQVNDHCRVTQLTGVSMLDALVAGVELRGDSSGGKRTH